MKYRRPKTGEEALLRWMGAKIEDPASIDWPARFRAAADAAEDVGKEWHGGPLRVIAAWLDDADPHVTEAIGRALLGETP